ncbi:MAG: Hsp20/alpha crystallin family protein [Myxococcota bacterium]|nr:Hsp20/alpha crystallin family protein [Myxococcota bacterium]
MRDATALLEELLTPPQAAPAAPAAHRPALDVSEHPDRYEIVADLPGVAPGSVEVELRDGWLRIRAERAREATPEDGTPLLRERGEGRFARDVAFRGPIDVDAVEASLRDGVLRVRVPKPASARPRRIPIAAGRG